MKKTCYIIGAGEIASLPLLCDCFVICADGGLRKAEEYGIKPDLIVGDFDSLGTVPNGNNVIVHPIEKDDTDMFLAVRCGIERGFDDFVIYGGLGGRLDHTLANIQLLKYLAENEMSGVLVGDSTWITAIKNGRIDFEESDKGIISVFSLTDKSFGVTIKNFKYETDRVELSSSFPLGVSNEFCGKKGSISVEDGTLLIIRKE